VSTVASRSRHIFGAEPHLLLTIDACASVCRKRNLSQQAAFSGTEVTVCVFACARGAAGRGREEQVFWKEHSMAMNEDQLERDSDQLAPFEQVSARNPSRIQLVVPAEDRQRVPRR
jgi:hypothetical protein